MALPEHHRTEELERIEKTLLRTPLESLTSRDLQLIGAFVQLYNFLELNLRRSVEVFAQAGLVEKSQALRTSKLIEIAKHAVEKMDPNQEEIDESLGRLTEIEYRRPFRNLLAHWAAKRIPGHDALVLLSHDSEDSRRLFGSGTDYDHCSYSILALPDLRGLVQHIATYEHWMAGKAAIWHQRYVNGP